MAPAPRWPLARFRAVGLLLPLLAGCGPPEAPDGAAPTENPWFEEVALASGLDFVHSSGHDGEQFLYPEIMGGGAALFDMDGDGDVDAYLVQSGSFHIPLEEQPPNRLFANRGDGTFDDVTAESGADDRGYGMGVAAADADGDADVDLYVTNHGQNVLLANRGDGRFSRRDDGGAGDPSWSVSAAFFDADADGDLDLFVVNYLYWSKRSRIRCRNPLGSDDYCSPSAYGQPEPDTLYRNDGGVFRDVSSEAGIRTAFGNGLGIVCSDFDGDGRQDVFVANDGTMNQLWHNEGDLRFRDAALLSGCAADEHGAAKACMGVSAADLDGDGDEDLLVVNIAKESDSFYRNDGEYFVDRTAQLGLASSSRPYTRFGCALLDFDNDGLLDLYVANGRVEKQSAPPTLDPYAEPNLLMRGTDDGRFVRVLPEVGTALSRVATSRAAAFGDVDGDGAIDVLVVNRDAPVHLLRNVAGRRGRSVLLRVLEANGRDAEGALLSASIDGRSVTRVVRSAYSYAAANDPRVHLGLAEARGVDDVTVRWVDGALEAFGSFPAGEVATLRRGEGSPR